MKTKPCDDCGKQTEYETIIIGGRDISATLPHCCEGCAGARFKAQEGKDNQERLLRAQNRYERTVPPKLRGTNINHPAYNLQAHKAIHNAYALDPSKNILLFGAAGRCKSRILARLCARAAFDGQSVAWITAHDFSMLAERYKYFRTRMDAIGEIERMKNVNRLVFDDLGKQEWTAQIEEVFFAVIDHRYSHNIPTWFSSNTEPEEMLKCGKLTKDRGASIVGRIVEEAHVFEFLEKPN